ncbi:MAG: outer membrane protein assembly factor BamA [Neisseriaceae bacterium]
MKNNIKKFLLCIGLIIASMNVYALTPFVIKNIRVLGLQRIEIGTVFSYLPVKVGDTLTESQTDEIVKKLYGSGFFKDIRLEQEDGALIINVIERPIIAELSITGDHAFDHDRLVKALNDNGLMSGRVFDQSVLDQAILSLKSEYYNRGLYSVKIDAQVIPLQRNRVAINIAISEGLIAKIVSIQFVGNKSFSDSKLRSLMFLSTGNWLSLIYKDNQYSNDKLSADVDNIKAFYLNQGYIKFKVSSIQVQLSPDKKSVYITVNMVEGDQYRLKDIKLGGSTKSVPKKNLDSYITLKPGDIVNQEILNRNIENIKTELGNYGYAFATVNPIPNVDESDKTVSYTLFVDTGNKIYIRKVNIVGNDKTRDVVIRREIRQTEGGLYSSNKIKRSKDRVNLLGYFDNVDVSTQAVDGVNNQADMQIQVKEKNTGSITGSVGYAQGQGLMLSAGISQSNLFGSGKAVSLNASTSAIANNIGLSFTDPYFRPNGTSLGYDLSYTQFMPYNLFMGSPYSTQTLSFKTRTSVPVSELDRINFSLGAEAVQVDLIGNNVPLRFVAFNSQYGSRIYDFPASVGWVRNTTDSLLWPTQGAIFSQTADATLPLTQPQYYRFTSQNTWFFPISENFTWKTSGMFGFINSYGGGSVPFYQNYYIGGIAGGSPLPGYYMNSIGPKDTDGSAIGGTRAITLSNDLLFPLPGLKDKHAVRMSAFFDMGTLWGGDGFNVTPQQSLRASYGLSLVWFSPLGPMKISYALPLFNQPNDILEPFQFMIGTSF